MNTPTPGQDTGGEDVFAIDPQETIWTLARQLVAGQRTVSQLKESASSLQAANPDDPAVLQHLSQLESTTHAWFHSALPNLLAAMQVAIEARDTFGPGFTRVDDPIDAAVWNNKFFVWRERLGGSIDDAGGGGSSG